MTSTRFMTTLTATATITSPSYDCTAQYSTWHASWSDGKKAWCCLHEDRGCAQRASMPTATIASMTLPVFTTTSSAPTSTLTTTVVLEITHSACDTVCVFGGSSASCKRRIQYAAIHDFLFKPSSCVSAHNLVLQECPSCFACPLSATGCATPAPPTKPAPALIATTTMVIINKLRTETQRMARTTPKVAQALGCQSGCSATETTVTCKNLVLLAANRRFAGEPDACLLAHNEVLKDCPLCSNCLLADVGCSTHAPETTGTIMTIPPRYNCQAGYSKWQSSWSTKKMTWCCQHESRGCPTLAG